MTLYRGPILNIFGNHEVGHHLANSATAAAASTPPTQHWVLGTICVLCSCLGWATFFILQVTNLFVLTYTY